MTEEKPVEHRFVFSGSAVAIGGRIRRPDDVFLKAAGVSHLPVTGGLSESHVEGPDATQYHYKEFLKFTEAHSRAQGDFTDPRRAAEFTHGNHGQNDLPVNTVVESRLLGLRIDAEADREKQTPRRVFQAKKLEVHMQTSSSRNSQATMRSLSAAFEDITLTTITQGTSGAVELKVLTATNVFSDNETKAKLMEKYAKDGDFRKKYASCFHPLGDGDKGFIGNLVGKHEIPHADRGPIVATFVTGLEWVGGVAPEGTEILNNRLTIHGLGRIYFGEIIVSEGYQRASLLRFELGSTTGGEVTVGEASSNGSHVPPSKTTP
jgi:hypothetical protein